jgi:hypothetical protein
VADFVFSTAGFAILPAVCWLAYRLLRQRQVDNAREYTGYPHDPGFPYHGPNCPHDPGSPNCG